MKNTHTATKKNSNKMNGSFKSLYCKRDQGKAMNERQMAIAIKKLMALKVSTKF